jgi:hypothetical protein
MQKPFKVRFNPFPVRSSPSYLSFNKLNMTRIVLFIKYWIAGGNRVAHVLGEIHA